MNNKDSVQKAGSQTDLFDMIEDIEHIRKFYDLSNFNKTLDKKFTGDWEKDRFEFEKTTPKINFKNSLR